MSSRTLGSRDVDRFLAEFHDIAPENQSAYAGRLKHISRQGFPPGVGAGRGTPAEYDADQFFQMLAVAELGEFYVPAAHAIRFVSEAWPRLRETVLEVWLAFDAADRGIRIDVPATFWSFPVEAQRHIARGDRPYSPDADYTLTVMTAKEANAAVNQRGYGLRRRAFIFADQLVHDALTQLKWATLGGHAALAAFMHSMEPAPAPMAV